MTGAVTGGDASAPLYGVRVVDTTDGRGEGVGRFLASLGADVILVEPPGGARARHRAPLHEGTSLYFAVRNAGKRGVTLDLDTEDGRHDLRVLLDTADIWIESERSGVPGFDYESVAARNPRLVLVTVTDFGLTGPYAGHAATDAVHAALSGLLCRSGLPGRPPLPPPGSIATESAHLQAAWAALLAHYSSLETGRGDHIDFSVHEAVTQILDPGFGVGGSATGGRRPADLPPGRPAAGHLYPIFRCADGLVRVCVLSPRQWRGMRAWLGEPEELADRRYENIAVRFQEADRIHARIADLFRDRSRDDLVRQGQEHGVPTAAVLTAGDALRAEHYLDRGALTDTELVPGLTARVPAGFLEIDGARPSPLRRAPLPGEHTDEVLAEVRTRAESARGEARPERGHPLAGLRVLDLGVIVAGAELGRLLADHGADVIKVENRAFPDGGRQSVTGEVITASASWGHRNKRSLGLNLRDPEGVGLFKRLAAAADVVLSNFKPGTLESLGLGPDVLLGLNPRLVIADSSAFGASGAWSRRMGYGPLVRASTGLSDLWRYPDDPDGHSDSITIYPDHVVGRVGAAAVVAQLARLRRTGRGGTVGIAQAEIILDALAEHLAGEWLNPGSLHAGAVTADLVVPCAGDDQWCVIGVRDDTDWNRLCAVVGHEGLAADPELARPEGRRAGRRRIEEALSSWTASRSPREITDLLQTCGVPAAPMLRVHELLTDPQLQARGFFAELRQPTFDEPLPTEARPAHSRHLADPPQRPAPLPAEHTRELSRELLGLSDEETDKLLARGVLETLEETPTVSSPAPAVLVERRGHVMVITLNRPEARNAVNAAVARGVGNALEEADHDPEIRAVVITGAGDKAFCAGADLKAVARGENITPPETEAWGFAGYVRHHIGKPTIAAVRGFALGGGTEIALASDLVVAAEDASFGLPEVKRGIIAAAGGAFRLAAQLPPKVAMELLLTGDPLDAATARDLGLVNRVVPAEKVLAEALALAERIAANAPLAVQASKRIARGITTGRVDAEQAAWDRTHQEVRTLMTSEDAQEGPRAFAEKRTPVWQAR
ncbi:crotonase/enoyl-CoA hydratase family protein [Streptomyces ipomoeae]|uniref:crotonase/enoyl-CoA hydratase family protein n=1 Tax=Streptomyces ipomoeae TaxID=103232 RepID=UPI001147095A|nr:crotonase/enoyl-CoA hydratase family protein [Streptomyces ipomoeae]TQE21180.1 crotonase/enoyl-CoA hydratase family protein [Streptomyces ipomoeae]